LLGTEAHSANSRALEQAGVKFLVLRPIAAAAEDMAPSYIYEIENGRVAFASLRILDRFAKALGMKPHELLAELDRELSPAGQADPPRGDPGA